jgi:hypothetical protein
VGLALCCISFCSSDLLIARMDKSPMNFRKPHCFKVVADPSASVQARSLSQQRGLASLTHLEVWLSVYWGAGQASAKVQSGPSTSIV